MVDEEEFSPLESGENLILSEAIEALRKNDPARARELLTRLLKTEQENATYWVWMSAAVETRKERIYCLQTAYQLDPDNVAARRGLVMLGVLPPDDSIPPFPLNHPRSWEETLIVEEIEPKKKGGMRKPLLRLGMIIGIGVVAIGLLYVAFIIPHSPLASLVRTPTRWQTRTPTPTMTDTPVYRTNTPTFAAPTPLWMLLPSTYTPTAQYVATDHPYTSRDAYTAVMSYLAQGDYQNAIVLLEQILTLEPNAIDAHYYIGESYLMMGNYNKALNAYQDAINLNPAFGPAYMGRALARQGLDQTEGVLNDLTRAIELDPNYDLPYIYRGSYRLDLGDARTALGDLKTAITLNPNSALAHLYLAQTQLALGNNEQALEAAIKANQLDSTLLPVYLVLGQAYQANGQVDKAMGALQTYTLYQPDNVDAMTVLGAAYNARGEYNTAVDILSRAIALDKNHVEANYQRGVAYLNLGEGTLAVHDFRVASGYDPTYFEAAVGLAMAYDLNGFTGDAYLQMESALGLAKTDEQKAIGYYYEAIFLEKIDDPQAAKVKWRYLLALPADAMPEEWRNMAMDHLGVTATPTRYFTPTPVMRLTTQTPQSTP